MTAEVAVLNLSAVALAADSAATIGNKIQTADKLFTLSKFHPVGIMIYGASSFCGIPFETIVKAFRRKQGTASHPSIHGYVDSFKEFLSAESVCTEARQRHFVSQFLHESLPSIIDSFQPIDGPKGKPTKAKIDREIKKIHRHVSNARILECLGDVTVEAIEAAYGQEIRDAIKDVFNGVPLSEASKLRVSEIAAQVLIKDLGFLDSGIVIAGFGEEELFPSVVELGLHGVVLGRIRCKSVRVTAMDRDGVTAQILPFAQKDMMYRFVEGVDENYIRFIDQSTRKMLTGFGAEIVKYVVPEGGAKAEALSKKVEKAVTVTHAAFTEEAQKFRTTTFIHPLAGVLVSLPKEDLANLAESLVSLTSLKRKMTMNERETVGGPVDVAVISKGDGFIWVKRKHYFKPELNPNFLANYYRLNQEA